MNRFAKSAVFALAALLARAPDAAAQANARAARIGCVYPAGGRQGTTLRVSAGGQFLDGAAEARISGAGVRVKVLEHTKPITQQQFNMCREQLKELTARKAAAQPKGRTQGGRRNPAAPAWTAEDEKLVAELRKKIDLFNKRTLSPAIAENVVLEVAIDRDAEPGERELRLLAALGLTNPIVFCVGQLPEFQERAPEADASRNRGQPAARFAPAARAPEEETEISLPAAINGRIMPGDVDRFRFEARAGERLVFAVRARRLAPYLADAVPGWFQAVLSLYDSEGRELAYVDDYRFSPDPVILYEIRADGRYLLEIRDSIYRGREDFVYRIDAGRLPFVTSVFPLGGRAGVATTVALAGWNLSADSLALGAEKMCEGLTHLRARGGELVSNRVPFIVDTLPERGDEEPNDAPDAAQRIDLPVIVNGRIGAPGDCDVFRFEGRAGDEIVAEVRARRLGSPLDSIIRLTDAGGRQIAVNDDCEDKGAGLLTHHADSWLRATLPAGGAYCVQVGDMQRKGGAEYAYRLRVSPPRHDFELRAVPSSINARPGATVPLLVHALRKDGFTGDIAIVLCNAPPGFALHGGRVPGGQDQVRLTLALPPAPLGEPCALRLEGRATIDGREVVRRVVPADDLMQAFAYRHLVPAGELAVASQGRPAPRAQARIAGDMPVRIPAGGTRRVLVETSARGLLNNADLALDEPPEGIAIKAANPSRGGVEIVFGADAAKAAPGLKGNLIVAVFAKRAAKAGAAPPKGAQRAAPLTMLPAIPFEIVAP